MLKKLMITTALSGALLGTAFAQSTPAPSTSTPGTTASTPSSAPTNSAAFINAQKPDQWLASKFRGTDVLGPNDEKIGDVSDLLFDKEGKIEAYVVGVGGFLGIGAKDVALAPSAFQVLPADKDYSYPRLKLSMSKDQLKQAANFEPYSPPAPARTTTGSTGGLGGSGSGMAPRNPASPDTPPSTNR